MLRFDKMSPPVLEDDYTRTVYLAGKASKMKWETIETIHRYMITSDREYDLSLIIKSMEQMCGYCDYFISSFYSPGDCPDCPAKDICGEIYEKLQHKNLKDIPLEDKINMIDTLIYEVLQTIYEIEKRVLYID